MAIVYGTSAHAAIDPYEAMVITPAEGNVTSLQHFEITFGGLPVVVNESAIPTLEKGGGATIEGQMSRGADILLINYITNLSIRYPIMQTVLRSLPM